MADMCGIRSITDFGELPVFETAATFPHLRGSERARPRARDRMPSNSARIRFAG